MSMQSTDPIADLLTRIRNAIAVGKTEVTAPASKIKLTVAEQLKKAGYLSAVKLEEGTPRGTIIITINEAGEPAKITEIQRVSKPGQRVYAKAADIPRVKSGRGIVLVSTSQGVMTGEQAKKARLGGEVLCKVY
ncbi:MAG TPA: 30S ribosomal protein S8 [Candidatus Saccharimonadales bacterium]|nr:30S ribosomal protein S8 [Candidatus Saccharimonadales bacterium]